MPKKPKSSSSSADSIFPDPKEVKEVIRGVISFIFVVGSALLTWNIAKIATNTESPIVVVLTGSMEPAFYRGDLLFVTHWKEDMVSGDIIVFSLPNQDIPIVHRAIYLQEMDDGKGDYVPVSLLDKGRPSCVYFYSINIFCVPS